MGQLLYGSARTTAAVRRAIQYSQESLRALAARYDINPKIAAQWCRRRDVEDARLGPPSSSTTLPLEEEAIAVAFRKHPLLPLDDCLYALQATIPQRTRSALHRCFVRQGISRLPKVESYPSSSKKKKFKSYPLGYFHLDIAEVATVEGKLYLFVTIDRISKFAVARLVERANTETASDFLHALVVAIHYRIQIITAPMPNFRPIWHSSSMPITPLNASKP